MGKLAFFGRVQGSGGGGGGSGTVTSVAWTTSQGVSAVISNPTTTPNITITLGALTGVTSFNGLVITANNGTITTGTWNGTAIGDSYITSTLTGKTYNGLTLTSLATGFSIAGGTASRTATVDVTGTVMMLAGGQTISSATWNGTKIGIAYGGTNLTTIASGSILGANALDTLTAITSTSGLKVLQNSSGTISWANSVDTGVKFPIVKSWDGQGSAVTTGNTRYFTAPYAMTITGWNISCVGSSPTCTIDIWKVATGTALPTVANTIMGTKPALSSGNAVRSSTMTGWTTLAISAGDILGFNIDACSNATVINFELEF